MPDILAFRSVKSANLSSRQKELIIATMLNLNNETMKDKLKKNFSYSSTHEPTS